jgi:hypothetical protein
MGLLWSRTKVLVASLAVRFVPVSIVAVLLAVTIGGAYVSITHTVRQLRTDQTATVASMNRAAKLAAPEGAAADTLLKASQGLAAVDRALSGAKSADPATIASWRAQVAAHAAVVADVAKSLQISSVRRAVAQEELSKRISALDPTADTVAATAQAVNFVGTIWWPLIVVLLVMFLISSRRASEWLMEILRRFKSVRFLSAELTLSEAEVERAADAVQRYRDDVRKQYDEWARREKIDEKLSSAMEYWILPHLREKRGAEPPPIRATIHVRDLLFDDSVYQLVEYYKGDTTGPTRGRVKSIRFGLIGKTWRSEEGDAVQEVIKGDHDLVLRWGMTKIEADRAAERQSAAAHVLRRAGGEPLAILYLDSREKKAFWGEAAIPEAERAQLLRVMSEACRKVGLVDSLHLIRDDFKGRSPLVTIYGS